MPGSLSALPTTLTPTHPSMPASTTSLRTWQRHALERLAGWREGPFLISAAPGAGKTRPALELARRLLTAGEIRRVIALCPTTPLTRQWARAAASLGLQLQPDAPGPSPPRGFDGVSVTYARVASAPAAWAREVRPSTLVIVDEAHHLGEDLTWGSSFARAFASAPRWLLLSGTPFRSDATPIPGVRYDREGLAVPDVSYTYAQAVADGVCRPVAFVTFDGSLSWRSGDEVIESTFDTVLSPREAGRRYRTAISTELPDGLPRIVGEAHAKLGELRAGEHRDAGGLAVAADATHARQVARLLHEATGRAPVVVLHTDSDAPRSLARFADSREPWIVAVNMVSEGVDIPRLRVGVYATAARTPLMFRQIIGRFVRTIPGRPLEPSWVFLPAEHSLRRHAAEIQTELRHALRSPSPQDDDAFDQRERRATERSPVAELVPLSADLTEQMTLFGTAGSSVPGLSPAPDHGFSPAQTRTASPPPTPPHSPHPPSPPPPPPPHLHSPAPHHPPQHQTAKAVPALFERREDLRRERSRLVAELHRRDGRSHREINAWLNRSLGVGRVQDASITQLERSVEMLVLELTRVTRPRAAPR